MAGLAVKHFQWLRTRSAWQDMEYHRQRRAEALKNDQAMLDSINSAMTAAMQNRISGTANNAAQAALKRVQAALKSKTDANTKQIDDAQRLIDQAQKSISPTTTTSAPKVNTVI